MLQDLWVVSQLFAQLWVWLLLGGSTLLSLQFIRKWDADSSSETQLYLERKTYLVSSIVQFALGFQILILLLFLLNSNHHLPGLLDGAMCATGSLGVNGYGYPVMYLKAGSVLLFLVFLGLNFLDHHEPLFPLTPQKYGLLFPIFLLVSLDLVFSVLYFQNIKPDVIATCCSVSFSSSAPTSFFELEHFYPQSLGLYGGVAILLFLSQVYHFRRAKLQGWPNKPGIFSIFQLILSFFYVALAMYTLRHFWVKYIYGLPSHTCIFDIFWQKYHYIGYPIFISYYLLLISQIYFWLFSYVRPKLQSDHFPLWLGWQWIGMLSLIISLGIPLAYYWAWSGQL